jgi:subtilisin-like proprotein convertase family protein
LLFLAVVMSATLVAAAPAVDVAQLDIVVWSDTGVMLTDATVVARDASGEFVKVGQLPSGVYSLPAIGPKTELQVNHPTLGNFTTDARLDLNGPVIRVDVVYTGVNEADIFSPNLIPTINPDNGNGAPANDDCENATPLGLGNHNVNNIGASNGGEPFCGTGTEAGTWYSVTGTGNTMTVSTCNQAQFDTKLGIYCGDCDDLTCVVGLDDTGGCASFSTEVSWCSQDGATYLILLHGFGGATGTTTMTVSDNGVACTATVECIPPVATGACCFDDGSCEILSEDDCAAGGGTYSGDDTGCNATGDAVVTDSGALNFPIADGLGTGVPGAATTHTMGVPSATIGDVDIDLTINHTWTGDLIVSVEHNGTTVVIVDRPGAPASTFGCAEDNWDIILDDEAGPSIESACSANLAGSYSPNNALSAFDNMDAGGNWTISVTDNAGADTGSLVSWSVHVSGAGAPTCEQPECHLVIGSGPGSDDFFASYHDFDTQVADIAASYPVLMEDIPSFVLPAVQTTGRVRLPTATTIGSASFGAVALNTPVTSESPAWMASGQFAVQVLMWNPQVFPFLPEQSTSGLHVYIMADGTVRTVPFGTDVGGLTISHELGENAAGQRTISFPFAIPGL